MAPPARYETRPLGSAPPVALAVRPSYDDTTSSHPAHGMTLPRLLSAFRAAEQGRPSAQFDAFEDYRERDGHLWSCDEGRRLAVVGKTWILKPGDDRPGSAVAAAELDRCLRRPTAPGSPSFRSVLKHLMGAVGDGVAAANFAWGRREPGDPWAPTSWRNVAARRLCALDADRVDQIGLMNGNTWAPEELEPGAWAIAQQTHRNPWASGRMRTCALWALFKSWSLRDWLTFAEMFGMPTAIGFYEPNASLETRRALENVVRNIGDDGYAVLEDTTDVVIKDSVRSGDATSVYPSIWDKCEAQMSKAYAGGTLTMDTGSTGSYAQATTHENRSFVLTLSDAMDLEDVINRDVCGPFVAWNGYGGAAAPVFRFQILRELSLKTRAEILQILALMFGKNLKFDEDQIREEFQLRRPTGAGLTAPEPPPPASSGGAVPGGKP